MKAGQDFTGQFFGDGVGQNAALFQAGTNDGAVCNMQLLVNVFGLNTATGNNGQVDHFLYPLDHINGSLNANGAAGNNNGVGAAGSSIAGRRF